MELEFSLASEDESPELAALGLAVATRLTETYGRGPWSSWPGEAAIRRGFRGSRVVVARGPGGDIVGSARLQTKKPWAIDVSYFTSAKRPLYLLDMAVRPDWQRRGVGRLLLGQALNVASVWPGDAVRLDAYDAPAGAGPFYAKCGWCERGRVTYRRTALIYYEHSVARVEPSGA